MQDYKKLLALGLLVTGTAGVVASQSAYADDIVETEAESAEMERHGPPPFDEDVTRTVEEIENGVIITLTTEDEDDLERLQNMSENPPSDGPFEDEVTREITLLDNGVQITLTSDDADVVEKLQNMPEPGTKPDFVQLDIDRTVENTENGVVITLTSDDPDTVEFLQNHADGFFAGPGPHGPHPDGDDFENGDDYSVEE